MRHIPYARQAIYDDDVKAVTEVLQSDFITQGPKVSEFERRVADYCGAKYAVALNSGTSALHAACFAAGIEKDDEVITSPISFAASANCVLYCGGKPVFADILEDTATIDPAQVKRMLTVKAKAIIPVDYAGHPAELVEIKDVAQKGNIIVIEDAAHSLGAEYKGTKTASCKYSDMAILSFHAIKHITTGEGGMVLANRKRFYDRLVMFRNHGITRDGARLKNKKAGPWFYEMQFLGFNYRLTDIQCGLGISQLRHLETFVRRRREIAAVYKRGFEGLEEISCLVEKRYVRSSWHIFPVRIKKKRRDNVFNRLRAKGIGVNVHYIPIYLHPYYKMVGYKKGLCPMAEKYYSEALTLPLYPAMTDADVRMIIRLTKDALSSS